MRVFWDLETHSACSLTDRGADIYASDPTTDVFFMCFAIGDGPVETWRPGDPVPPPFADPTGHDFVADNFEFERLVHSHVLVPRYGFAPIPIEQTYCAQRLALANAYPAELGRRCEALDLPYRKDPEARRAMLRLSRRSHKYKRPEDRERDLALLRQRCKTDVESTRACYNHPRLRPLLPVERHLVLIDAKINTAGICANVAFLQAADALAMNERDAINARLCELTDGAITSVDQVPRIVKAVNARGHKMTSLGKRSVAATLAHQPEDFTRELLQLRQRGAFASTRKFRKLLDSADPNDHRIRGALRYHGGAPGRWASLSPNLHNMPRNDAELPSSLVDALIAGDRAELERYGNPLQVVSGLSRAALCATPGHVLICADFSTIESRITAWLSGEQWKLRNFERFDQTGDKNLDLYRILAHRMLKKTGPVSAITAAERQPGKYMELASGFGGSVGAWRKIAGDDGRSDAEIKAIVGQWRSMHPATCAYWRKLARAAHVAIRTGRSTLVAPAPRPPIVAAFDGHALTLTLPSNRAISYPLAHLSPNTKFQDGEPDVEYHDNSKGQWKPTRAWYGTLIENVVQGTARDLLAAAIIGAEARGWSVVHHCHDELVVEAPEGAVLERDVLALLLEPPAWAEGLPLNGKVHSGPLYLEAPLTAEPPAAPIILANITAENEDTDTKTSPHVELTVELPDDRERTRREGSKFSNDFNEAPDFAAREAPDTSDDLPPWEGDDIVITTLNEIVEAPITAPALAIADSFSGFTSDVQGYDKGKISCPFHADRTPSCQLYADGHYHCFGCGAHGWISEDLDVGDDVLARAASAEDDTRTLERGLELWGEGKPITGTLAERYLVETRKLDLAALPNGVDAVLRYHARCPFGANGARHPCLLALFRDVETDAPSGIHRIGLTPDANKIKRLTLGRWPSPRAIKLWPVTHKLTIGEGIETVLGAIRKGAITPPAWAMGPKADIASFPVLPGVQALTVLVDRGDPAALDGAEACTMRYATSGIHARWLRTVRVKDFNDLVMS